MLRRTAPLPIFLCSPGSACLQRFVQGEASGAGEVGGASRLNIAGKRGMPRRAQAHETGAYSSHVQVLCTKPVAAPASCYGTLRERGVPCFRT